MAQINFGSEKDMVDVYVETLEEYSSHKMGHDLFREVTIGNYGRIDLMSIGLSTDIKLPHIITIYEFKNRCFEIRDIIQVSKYKSGVDAFLKENKIKADIHMVIVCTGIDAVGDTCFVADLSHNLTIEVADISISGVTFDRQSDYYIKNHGFGNMETFQELIKHNGTLMGHVPKVPDISASVSASSSEIKKVI